MKPVSGPPDSGAPRERSRRWMQETGIIAFTLVVGCSSSWMLYRALETAEILQIHADVLQVHDRLSATGQSVVDSFDADLTRAQEAVRGAGLMIAARPRIKHRNFLQYSEMLMTENTSLQFLEWLPVVPAIERFAFEAAARADGAPNFMIREAQGDQLVAARPRAEYVPILFASPERQSIIGRDLNLDPARMHANLQARDIGMPVTSETFPIMEKADLSNGSQAPRQGFAITAPVYWPGPATTPEQRREHLRGYVAGVIELATIFREAAFRADASKLDLYVFDQASLPRKLIFSSRGSGNDSPAVDASKYQADAHDLLLTIDVGGRPWDLVLHPRESFFAIAEPHTDRLALMAGLLGTLLLAFAQYRQQRGRRLVEANQRIARQAERALAAERHELSNILAGTNAGTWEWQIQSGQLRVNERAAEICGYALAELQPTTIEVWNSMVHPDDLAIANAQLTRHFSGEQAYFDAEMRMLHKNGSWIWVSTRGRVFERLANGLPAKMAGTYLDIDQRKRVDAELQQSQANYENLTNRIPVGVFVSRICSNGQIQMEYVSGQFCRLCGVCAVEALADARAVIDRIHIDDHGRFLERCREVGRTLEPLRWEGRLHVGGQTRWISIEASGTRQENGDSIWNGVLQDITDSRAARQALIKNERFLRLLTEVFPGMVAYWTPDLRCSFANGAHLEWFGKTNEQMLGIDLGTLLGAADFASTTEHISKVLCGEARHFERARQKPDGSVGFTWTHYIPDLDASDHLLRGFFTVVADITEIKNAQLKLERLNVELKTRTGEAEAASQAKGQFLANMSHELRTPMNGILGLLQLLRSTELSPRQLDYASKTETAARSLLGILNDILDFSKVEAGKMVLEQLPFRFDRLMRELAVLLPESIGYKALEIVFDIDARLPPVVQGDALRLKQVLLNLSSNAIKFTSEGEVVIAISEVARTDAEVEIRFEVRDTGIGISPLNLQRIFDGFSQAEASTTRRFGGTGLGLAISQRLVRLMGGELQLESTLGWGSKFFFHLHFPLADEGEPESHAGLRRLSPLRALIIDDNATARTVLTEMAESFGWQVDQAESGEQALGYFTAQADLSPDDCPYHVILVDWYMPGMDGWKTAQCIRQQYTGNNTPMIVMITAQGREKLAQRMQEEQNLLDGFLIKPVTASMLFDAVAYAQTGKCFEETACLPAEIGEPRLAGLRILVVEDNPTNQQVAHELLSQEGAHIELACDGRAGVAALAAADPMFDAVLMDIQMPEMDGYAATAEIRQTLGLSKLPIIAMTANALPSDRATCLAADMNEHIGKPFDLNQLVNTILRQIGKNAAGNASVPAPPANPDQIIDSDGAMARMHCTSDFYFGLVKTFLRDLIELDAQLRRTLAADPQQAARLLHAIKGSAATIGAVQLAGIASSTEAILKGADTNVDYDALLHSVIGAMDATATCLGNYLHQNQQPEPPPVEAPPDLLRQKLEALAALLGRANLRALDVCQQISREHARQLAPFADLVGGLENAVGKLNFVQALACCSDLIQHLDQ